MLKASSAVVPKSSSQGKPGRKLANGGSKRTGDKGLPPLGVPRGQEHPSSPASSKAMQQVYTAATAKVQSLHILGSKRTATREELSMHLQCMHQIIAECLPGCGHSKLCIDWLINTLDHSSSLVPHLKLMADRSGLWHGPERDSLLQDQAPPQVLRRRKTAEKSSPTGLWVHSACVLWSGEATFGDPDRLDEAKLDGLTLASISLSCSFCHQVRLQTEDCEPAGDGPARNPFFLTTSFAETRLKSLIARACKQATMRDAPLKVQDQQLPCHATQMASFLVYNGPQAAHQAAHHPNDPGCSYVTVQVKPRACR